MTVSLVIGYGLRDREIGVQSRQGYRRHSSDRAWGPPNLWVSALSLGGKAALS